MKAPHTKSFTRALVPPGTHAARVYMIADLGIQETTFKAETKNKRMIMFRWELLDETISIDGKDVPMTVGKEFSFSMHELAGLRKMIESIVGKRMTDKEAYDFDVSTLIGIPCLLGISHATSEAGNQYAKITSWSPPMKNMVMRELSLDAACFDLDAKDVRVFATLPDWLKTKIGKSAGFQSAIYGSAMPQDKDEDDIPF